MSPPKRELTVQTDPPTLLPRDPREKPTRRKEPAEMTRDPWALESSDGECPRALNSSVEAGTYTRGGEGASGKHSPPRGV